MPYPKNVETCRKGLHPWVEENIYNHPTNGSQTCRACKREANRNPPEETHKQNASYCRKGHSYTVENTLWASRKVNGQVVKKRVCKRCRADSLRTRR